MLVAAALLVLAAAHALVPENIQVFDYVNEPIKAKEVEGHFYKVEIAAAPLKTIALNHLYYALFDRTSPSTVRVTLRRLDNHKGMIARPQIKPPGMPPKLWGAFNGWKKLLLTIDREHSVLVPQNLTHDSMSFDVALPASSAAKRTTSIPRYIFQATGSTTEVPWHLHKSTMSWRELNPDWHYELCSNERQRELVVQLEGERTTRAFDDLKPGAYKADLFRYVVLYHHGGVYADDKVTCRYPLDFVLPTEPGQGVITYDLDKRFLSNGLMMVPARHPWMRAAIDAVVSNVEQRSYAEDCLLITGPGVLAKTFAALPSSVFSGWYLWEAEKHFYGVIDPQSQDMFAIYANYNYRLAGYGAGHNPNHYGNLYRSRNVYYELDRQAQEEKAENYGLDT